jgi:hypothetical protein
MALNDWGNLEKDILVPLKYRGYERLVLEVSGLRSKVAAVSGAIGER